MDELLQQYKDYYRLRAQRYANNPKYAHSFEAESNLSNAMQSCNELIEFKDKIGNLNELSAVALSKDDHQIEKEFYDRHQEAVRTMAASRILEKIDSIQNVTDLVTLVLEESNKNSLEISMDEYHREFQSDWKQLDDIEVFENAVVPEKYKSKMQATANEIKQRLVQSVNDLEQEGRKFQPDWTYQPIKNMEHRHRRLIPYSDAHLNEQLSKYKSLVNR